MCEYLPHLEESLVLHQHKHSLLHLKNKNSGKLHPLDVYETNNSTKVIIYSSDENVEGSEVVA